MSSLQNSQSSRAYFLSLSGLVSFRWLRSEMLFSSSGWKWFVPFAHLSKAKNTTNKSSMTNKFPFLAFHLKEQSLCDNIWRLISTYLDKLGLEEAGKVDVVGKRHGVSKKAVYAWSLGLAHAPPGGQVPLLPLPQQLVKLVPAQPHLHAVHGTLMRLWERMRSNGVISEGCCLTETGGMLSTFVSWKCGSLFGGEVFAVVCVCLEGHATYWWWQAWTTCLDCHIIQ